MNLVEEREAKAARIQTDPLPEFLVLTVKGKAAAVVQDAQAYQRLLDIAARADAEEGIRQAVSMISTKNGMRSRWITVRVNEGTYWIGSTPGLGVTAG